MTIADGGRTVIVSSHLLGELEQVCDWLIVVDHGGLVHLGTPESLGGTGEALVLRADGPRQLDDRAAHRRLVQPSVSASAATCSSCSTTRSTPASSPPRSTAEPSPLGSCSSELHYRRADLEARYLNLVNQSTRTRSVVMARIRSEWILLNRQAAVADPRRDHRVYTVVATALVISTASRSSSPPRRPRPRGSGQAWRRPLAVIFSVAFAFILVLAAFASSTGNEFPGDAARGLTFQPQRCVVDGRQAGGTGTRGGHPHGGAPW